jgi:acetoacetate decarboxylase
VKRLHFHDAEMLTVLWETKTEIVKRVLPPPLNPLKRPIALAFIAHYPNTNQGLPYNEGALMIRCEYNGEFGNYYLAMPVTDDRALLGGREIFGFPKKMAKVHLERNDDEVYGYAERLGVKNIEIRAHLGVPFNEPETPQLIKVLGLLPGRNKNTINYNFKYFPAPNKEGFDYNPWLVKQETAVRPKSMETGRAEITLRSSVHDPWGEIEIETVFGALYLKTDNTMYPGQKISEVDTEEFLPYSFINWDWY